MTERVAVLAEVVEMLDGLAEKVSVDDEYWLGVLHGITHSRDHVRSLTEPTDTAIAACEPAIRADERRRVLAEAERLIEDSADRLAEQGDRSAVFGALRARDAIRSLAASTDSKGDSDD